MYVPQLQPREHRLQNTILWLSYDHSQAIYIKYQRVGPDAKGIHAPTPIGGYRPRQTILAGFTTTAAAAGCYWPLSTYPLNLYITIPTFLPSQNHISLVILTSYDFYQFNNGENPTLDSNLCWEHVISVTDNGKNVKMMWITQMDHLCYQSRCLIFWNQKFDQFLGTVTFQVPHFYKQLLFFFVFVLSVFTIVNLAIYLRGHILQQKLVTTRTREIRVTYCLKV